MIIPVVLAGGAGTRLWPLSREAYPKQLLSIMENRTMVQNTVLRLVGLEDVADPIVICNESHRFLVAEQLRAIGVESASIILEPLGRNTAPAIAVAALRALSLDKDAVLVILPSDHHINDKESFRKAVKRAVDLARQGFLSTFGIVPVVPETGYGYIRKGEILAEENGQAEVSKIDRFVEKPDRKTAQEYVASGDYLWNSGMFVFLASRLLEEMRKFAPDIVAACRTAYENGLSDLDFFRLDGEAFEACRSDSIDYAVMEKTECGVMVPLAAGWNDVGSWDALWEIQEKDNNHNVTVGDVLTHDVEHSYLHSTSRLIAAIGVRDHIVVETADAVFVCPWDRAQDVKLLVQELKTRKRDETLMHTKVYRPWGCYECINVDHRFQVKRITVKPGAILSLQRHHHRAEHWVVAHGTALVTCGNQKFLLKEDESTYIPLGVDHRLENPGKIPLELIEVQSGSYLGEDDIVRLEDVYGR